MTHPELLNLNINEEYTSTKLNEIKKQLTCKERSKYRKKPAKFRIPLKQAYTACSRLDKFFEKAKEFRLLS